MSFTWIILNGDFIPFWGQSIKHISSLSMDNGLYKVVKTRGEGHPEIVVFSFSFYFYFPFSFSLFFFRIIKVRVSYCNCEDFEFIFECLYGWFKRDCTYLKINLIFFFIQWSIHFQFLSSSSLQCEAKFLQLGLWWSLTCSKCI